LTGTFNLAGNVFAPLIGAWINDQFVGVKADDLSGYPKLQWISFGMSFAALPLLYLVPLKKDIEEWQEARKRDAAG
jgi:MFS family permease